MKKVFSKPVSLILTLFLVMSMAACGSQQTRNEASSGTTASSAALTSSSSQQSDNDDPFGKYPEPIEISVVRVVSDQMQKNTLKDNYTMDKNPWTDAYLNELGIKLVHKWVAKSNDEYNTKLNLAISTGDIPDIMDIGREKIPNLVEGGMIIDMGPYYDQYASDRTREIVNLVGESVWKSVMIDGKRYAIPRITGNTDDIRFAWLRTDWLNKVGMKAPQNYQELYNAIEAFATKDPDGNNKNDTFGLALSKNFSDSIVDTETFFFMYHSYPNQFVNVNGKLEWGGVQPEARKALEELSKIYAQGWIDQEFGVKDATKVGQDFVAGRVGLTLGRFWAPLSPVLNDVIQSNKEADFISVPITGLGYDGKTALSSQGIGYSTAIAVSKNCKNPEAIIKMFNLYNTLYNDEYTTYGSTSDGREMWHLSPISMLYGSKNVKSHLKVVEVMNNKKTVESQNMLPEEKSMYDNCAAYLGGDRTMWNWYRIFGPEEIGGSSLAAVAKYGLNDKQYQQDGFLGAPGQVMTERKSMLVSMQNEIFVKIIIGEAPITQFDKFVQDWKAAGGDEMTNEVNEWYSKDKSNQKMTDNTRTKVEGILEKISEIVQESTPQNTMSQNQK